MNRLVLILKTAPQDCPIADDEALVAWIARANRFYAGQDASHGCDNSQCCNPEHLSWQAHTDNVHEQAQRRRRRVAA